MHDKWFVNSVSVLQKYVYDFKSVLNMFCFCEPICGLNMNLIDYAFNSIFEVKTLALIIYKHIYLEFDA